MWTVKLIANFGQFTNKFQTAEQVHQYLQSVQADSGIRIFRTYLKYVSKEN